MLGELALESVSHEQVGPETVQPQSPVPVVPAVEAVEPLEPAVELVAVEPLEPAVELVAVEPLEPAVELVAVEPFDADELLVVAVVAVEPLDALLPVLALGGGQLLTTVPPCAEATVAHWAAGMALLLTHWVP